MPSISISSYSISASCPFLLIWNLNVDYIKTLKAKSFISTLESYCISTDLLDRDGSPLNIGLLEELFEGLLLWVILLLSLFFSFIDLDSL